MDTWGGVLGTILASRPPSEGLKSFSQLVWAGFSVEHEYIIHELSWYASTNRRVVIATVCRLVLYISNLHGIIDTYSTSNGETKHVYQRDLC